MDEHDDDLESEVEEDAEIETDTFAVTGDELDSPSEEDDDLGVDDDDTEL